LANNATYYADVLNGPPGTIWTGPRQTAWWKDVTRRTAGLSEPAADRLLTREVWKLARQRPRDFARASLARLGRFWGVAPSGAVYSPALMWITAAWTVPLWIALLLGLCRREIWRWPRITAPLVLLGLTAVHTFYWTDLRMRAPAVPAIGLIVATVSPVARGSRPRPI
jgi:hypothetical protein